MRIFALGITEDVYEPFLAAISGDIGVGDGQKTPGYDYLQVADFTALNTQVSSVSSGICTGNKPSKILSKQQDVSKYSCLKVYVPSLRHAILFTELRGCDLIDLCIVIDSSGSIRDNNPQDGSFDNWNLILDFVKQVSVIISFYHNNRFVQYNSELWNTIQTDC